MSANSAGVQAVPSLQAELKISALDDPMTLQALDTLHNIVHTSLGPTGKLKMLHNNIGGHVTVTSTSSRLFNSIGVATPVLKLITSAVAGHLQQYNDGGLFTATLATALIRNSLSSTIHRRLLIEIYENILLKCLEILKLDFQYIMHLNFENTNDILNFIKSLLQSKPGCCLFPNDLEDISNLILRAFLSVCPVDDYPYGMILYLTVDGLSLPEASLYDGVLLEAPHIPAYKALQWQLQGESTAGNISVALFTMSLSGDSGEKLDTLYEVDEDVDDAGFMLQDMIEKMKQLLILGIRMLFCQRVIHPCIKAFFKQHRVTVLDRLGKTNMEAMHKLAGGQLIGSVNSTVELCDLGHLDNASAIVLQGKTYLHLTRIRPRVTTVVLGHQTEEMLQELKTTMMRCEDVLKLSLDDSRVLAGGGCWQRHLVSQVKYKILESKEELTHDLGCSPHQLSVALENFCRAVSCITKVLKAGSDPVIECITEDEHLCDTANYEVLDSFPVMLNAFQTAIGIANLVLSIDNVIIDTN